jgi:OOP family OmpA-OmpF porin
MRNESLLGVFMALLVSGISMPSTANSAIYRDAVRDKSGNFVLDSKGDCVRTQWATSMDPCLEYHDIIEKIMLMEERKIYFDFDKAIIKDFEKDKLRTIANVLKQHNITKIKIIGYTDRIGTEGYNYKLSQRRAEAVRCYINSLIHLDSSKLEIRGLGKTHQVEPCAGIHKRDELIDCLAPNRRVEIEVDYYDITASQHMEN